MRGLILLRRGETASGLPPHYRNPPLSRNVRSSVTVKASCAAILLTVLVATGASGREIPPPPPLPHSGWPSAAEAREYARVLIDSVPPARLGSLVTVESIPAVFRNLGGALLSDDHVATEVAKYLNAVTTAAAQRMDLSPRVIATMQLVDPLRYRADTVFRSRVDDLLTNALDATVPRDRRIACLEELTAFRAMNDAAVENIMVGWGLASRRSVERRLQLADGLMIADDASTAITASIFSLTSDFFTPDEAMAFLVAVRAAAPKREIVVLTDAALRSALEPALKVEYVDTAGRPITPWPRDPFLIGRRSDGTVVFINRPNLQPRREGDALMVPSVVRGISDALDRQWNHAQWAIAETPFHNGHVLLMPDAAWISIHTVELRTLQILGIDRVPVDTFDSASGINRYVEAVKSAARELERIYDRPVRFVHPLPGSESEPDQVRLMRQLGGGAGFDLDSLVTLLPGKEGSVRGLVADIRIGASLAGAAKPAEWEGVHRAYRFRGRASTLGRRIAQAQSVPRTAALGEFLDVVAEHLEAERLPLLNVPFSMIDDDTLPGGASFLMTWNNVVLDGRRAEGFASLFRPGDGFAHKAFAKSDVHLKLFPPLVRSIILSGGYRCASNHVRALPISKPAKMQQKPRPINES